MDNKHNEYLKEKNFALFLIDAIENELDNCQCHDQYIKLKKELGKAKRRLKKANRKLRNYNG